MENYNLKQNLANKGCIRPLPKLAKSDNQKKTLKNPNSPKNSREP